MNEPFIGITLGGRAEYRLMREYTESVAAAGMRPLLLCPRSGIPSCVSGLVFTGGGDLSPAFAGYAFDSGLSGIDAERDRYEFALVRWARSARVPVLGICRGMQVLNAALGGTLYADLSAAGVAEKHVLAPGALHPIRGINGSRLFGAGKFFVNSSHHQAVDRIAAGLYAAAVSPAGIVEALEDCDDLLLGVQFHPERMRMPAIFQWLKQAASIACKSLKTVVK